MGSTYLSGYPNVLHLNTHLLLMKPSPETIRDQKAFHNRAYSFPILVDKQTKRAQKAVMTVPNCAFRTFL